MDVSNTRRGLLAVLICTLGLAPALAFKPAGGGNSGAPRSGGGGGGGNPPSVGGGGGGFHGAGGSPRVAPGGGGGGGGGPAHPAFSGPPGGGRIGSPGPSGPAMTGSAGGGMGNSFHSHMSVAGSASSPAFNNNAAVRGPASATLRTPTFSTHQSLTPPSGNFNPRGPATTLQTGTGTPTGTGAGAGGRGGSGARGGLGAGGGARSGSGTGVTAGAGRGNFNNAGRPPIQSGGPSFPAGGQAFQNGGGQPPHRHGGGEVIHPAHVPPHTGATFHNGFQPGTHLNPGYQNAAFAHHPAVHVSNMGVARFGNYNVHLAGAGYHPAYFHHSFYHGPWSGHAYGWGWGLSPALGWGFGWGAGGWGVSAGWGYGGWGPASYWGPYGYWGRPLGWGFGSWGLGCGVYSCGYYPYYNPYYVVPTTTTIVYNYSNPIPVDTVAVVTPPADGTDPGPGSDNPDFDAARAAFHDADYGTALSRVDAAIERVPTDAVLHEFRALVLFALLEYRQAAGVAHSVLAVGPGWDWTTMSSLYADPGLYTQQLRALEDYTLAHPEAGEAHFLLAYHYMICSHKEAAANQLRHVIQLEPKDRLAGELLKMVQGPAQPPAADDPNATPRPGPDATDAPPEPPAIDKQLLPGRWQASRPDGSKFTLKLTEDGEFSWTFSGPQQKGDEFSGTYTTDGPVLILQRAGNAGALAGVATFAGDDRFNFKMVGGPPEDKGLDFSK